MVKIYHYQGNWAQYKIRMGLKIRCYTGFNKDGSRNKGGQGNSSGISGPLESATHQRKKIL